MLTIVSHAIKKTKQNHKKKKTKIHDIPCEFDQYHTIAIEQTKQHGLLCEDNTPFD